MNVLLRNSMAPGDILMLTAAVRDLKRSHPNIRIGVDTTCRALWDNNPNVTLDMTADDADKLVYADYPLYKENNRLPYHFIHGFRMFLEDVLGLKITQGEFKPDIYLSDKEKDRGSINRLVGRDTRYWIINAGGKSDFTNKQWAYERYQEVVDRTCDKITWVQTGSSRSMQPLMRNVVDLVGRTSLRDMVSLMYHADGCLTGVSFPMHLAAMDTPSGVKRPCVVVAGGREPSTWEAYPTHQFIHNCGCYDCNREGGCWKARVKKLFDGDHKHDASLCAHPVDIRSQVIPRCMADISVEDVVSAIHRYFHAGRLLY